MQIVISFNMKIFIYWSIGQLDLSMVKVNVLVIYKNGLRCGDLV